MNVLLVGAYQPLIKSLRQGLEEEGFTIEVAIRDREGTSAVSAADYDAIVLDLVCPREAGLGLLRSWRRAGLKARVLVLSAPGSSEDKALHLDAGADDWLTKPFELDDLLARLRTLVGRTDPVRDINLRSHGKEHPTAATPAARRAGRRPDFLPFLGVSNK